MFLRQGKGLGYKFYYFFLFSVLIPYLLLCEAEGMKSIMPRESDKASVERLLWPLFTTLVRLFVLRYLAGNQNSSHTCSSWVFVTRVRSLLGGENPFSPPHPVPLLLDISFGRSEAAFQEGDFCPIFTAYPPLPDLWFSGLFLAKSEVALEEEGFWHLSLFQSLLPRFFLAIV